MYTLLIADDEVLEGDAIELLVTRAKLPLRVIKAHNGVEAVNLAALHKPEIVFLDIQMPAMDGIEAGTLIRQADPFCEIVFLTAWSTFDFAQQAIRIGAREYLVKPVQHQEVYALLNRLLSALDERKEEKQRHKEEILSTFTLVSREFFAAMKYGRLSEEQMASYFTALGITTSEGAALVIGGLAEEEVTSFFANERIWQRADLSCFPSPDRTTAILFTTQVSKILEEIYERFLTTSLTIGVGTLFSSLEEIPRAIATASIAYSHATAQSVGFLRYSDALPTLPVREKQEELSQKLLEATFDGDTREARQIAHELIDLIPDTLLSLLTVLTYEVHKHIPFLQRLPIPNTSVMEQEMYLMDLIDHATEAVIIDRRDRHERAFAYVGRYLEEHLDQSITPDEMAKRLDLNLKYFGKLCKEYLGSTFSEYLTKVRMEKALALLKEGDHTVKSVAEATGYGEPNYFSRVFRQYYGYTPSSLLE